MGLASPPLRHDPGLSTAPKEKLTSVLHLLAVIGIVFAINLLPAFGPPTWAVLVFVRFQWHDIPPAALIAGGALAATTGRLVLAAGTRKLRGRLSPKRRANLEALGQTLAKSKTGVVASLAAVVLMIKLDWIKIIDWTRARFAGMRGKPAPPSVRIGDRKDSELRGERTAS